MELIPAFNIATALFSLVGMALADNEDQRLFWLNFACLCVFVTCAPTLSLSFAGV